MGLSVRVTPQKIAVMGHKHHMITTRQMVVEEGEEGLTTAEQFYALAA